MPTLAEQVRRQAHLYVAHGGKTNRRQQVDQLVIMVSWMQAEFRLTGIEQIGRRQVIAFWKALLISVTSVLKQPFPATPFGSFFKAIAANLMLSGSW